MNNQIYWRCFNITTSISQVFETNQRVLYRMKERKGKKEKKKFFILEGKAWQSIIKIKLGQG